MRGRRAVCGEAMEGGGGSGNKTTGGLAGFFGAGGAGYSHADLAGVPRKYRARLAIVSATRPGVRLPCPLSLVGAHGPQRPWCGWRVSAAPSRPSRCWGPRVPGKLTRAQRGCTFPSFRIRASCRSSPPTRLSPRVVGCVFGPTLRGGPGSARKCIPNRIP